MYSKNEKMITKKSQLSGYRKWSLYFVIILEDNYQNIKNVVF